MTENSAVVLIAEDEPLASMALQAQVEALGHTVAGVARDGQEAAAMVRCLPVDLAIFDMMMPRIHGLDVALQIFPDAPTPVLLLTGLGAGDLPDPVPRPPVFGLLTKPIGLLELKDGIVRTRASFRAWMDEAGTEEGVRAAREDRRDIARAVAQVGGDDPAPLAAGRFLARAEAERIPAAELARRILRSDAGA